MAAGTREVDQAFWQDDTEAVLARLDTSSQGLSTDEAGARLARYGPNSTTVSMRTSLWRKLLRRLAEPLIAILLIAALVSGATGDWQSCTIIVVIVLCSTLLDIMQEHKAEATVEALRHSVAVTAEVRRDGKSSELPVAAIVPGDIVTLRAGDLVAADGIVLTANDVLADEATLTGEPYAVEKRPGPSAAAIPAEAFNALFAGTSIVAGEATMLVVATGGATRFGAVAASLNRAVPPTAFERGMHALGMLILRLTGFLVLFVVLTQLARHGLNLEGFLFAVALAVGLTPELLPMITTVTLARGGERMAGKRVVVKRLSAIHDLGAIDVLCTDKTGTLTQTKISLEGSFGTGDGDCPRALELLRRNSRFVRGMHNALDEAALAGADVSDDGWSLLDDIPFDFHRRRASVLVTDGTRRELIVKGAPETLLALCRQVEQSDGTLTPLDEPLRAQLQSRIDGRGAQGIRLLGVARRDLPEDRDTISATDENGLVFVGCAGFVDPPKVEAAAAVDRLLAAGIRVKIISGDALPVVQHIVSALHLPARGALGGEEIARLSDAGLARRVQDVDLFARVSPEQKARIVTALRRRGHTVGFMGDGINDAPAIHAADIGISVDGGTEVAREAADIILMAPDLGLVADGVAEGRRSYANIMKYIRMGTSSNFGNMLSMAAASVFLPFLPLAPIQVLLNNLLYDLSEIGIPFDAADPDDLATPKTWDMRAILRFTLIMGPLSSAFDLITFAWLELGLHADIPTFRTAWFVESITTQILVIFIIRTGRPLWQSRPDRLLVGTSLGGLALALLIALTPMGRLLGFDGLASPVVLGIAVIALGYLACAEVTKRLIPASAVSRRKRGRKPVHEGRANRPAPIHRQSH